MKINGIHKLDHDVHVEPGDILELVSNGKRVFSETVTTREVFTHGVVFETSGELVGEKAGLGGAFLRF